jgi:hypothetical protein
VRFDAGRNRARNGAWRMLLPNAHGPHCSGLGLRSSLGLLYRRPRFSLVRGVGDLHVVMLAVLSVDDIVCVVVASQSAPHQGYHAALSRARTTAAGGHGWLVGRLVPPSCACPGLGVPAVHASCSPTVGAPAAAGLGTPLVLGAVNLLARRTLQQHA